MQLKPNSKTALILLLVLCLANLKTTHGAEQLMEKGAEIQFATANFGGTESVKQSISYAFSGNTQKPGLLFIHGTPGDWTAFEDYLANPSLQENYFMVSVDRFGWGKSEVAKANSQVSYKNTGQQKNLLQKKAITGGFSLQARSISAIIEQYPGKKWLIIGHSLGASIAPKIALIEENKVSGLLLLAGSLSPALGKPRWYNRIARTIIVKWVLPKKLNDSNDEIMALRGELTKLDSEIKSKRLEIDVVVIQGLKDRLVSPKNALYVKQNWQNSFTNLKVIELPNAGHFIPWEQSSMVMDTIREFKY